MGEDKTDGILLRRLAVVLVLVEVATVIHAIVQQ